MIACSPTAVRATRRVGSCVMSAPTVARRQPPSSGRSISVIAPPDTAWVNAVVPPGPSGARVGTVFQQRLHPRRVGIGGCHEQCVTPPGAAALASARRARAAREPRLSAACGSAAGASNGCCRVRSRPRRRRGEPSTPGSRRIVPPTSAARDSRHRPTVGRMAVGEETTNGVSVVGDGGGDKGAFGGAPHAMR